MCSNIYLPIIGKFLPIFVLLCHKNLTYMEEKKYSAGDRFMILRKLKGFKQEEMAAQLNIDPKTLSKIENNEVQPKVDLIEKFSKILNISIEEFFRFNEGNIFHNNIHESSQFELNNTKITHDEMLYSKLLEEKDKRIEERNIQIIEKKQEIKQLQQEIQELRNKLGLK